MGDNLKAKGWLGCRLLKGKRFGKNLATKKKTKKGREHFGGRFGLRETNFSMMILGNTSNYPNGMPIYGVSDEVISSSIEPNSATSSSHPTSFLYNLSLLKDKVHQVQSLATIFLPPDHSHLPESTSIAMPTMGTLIQEIIVTASSMMFSCQQIMAHDMLLPSAIDSSSIKLHDDRTKKIVDRGCALAPSSGISGAVEDRGHTGFYTDHRGTLEDQWYDDDNYNNFNSTVATSNGNEDHLPAQKTKMINKGSQGIAPKTCEGIIELDAADLLAKYTHYCQVCSKGFKRDANLRMHMRAHGDEYKSSAALSNPNKNNVNSNHGVNSGGMPNLPRNWKYSCPQEGCRWNKKHEKFQPLKSMICAKNHYKRSHCPKMYVCKRCNRKQFSVLSDLRTHEKHCGDLKWQCSCGTTFSRKDKLLGHVALFIGHSPAVTSFIKMGNTVQTHAVQMQ